SQLFLFNDTSTTDIYTLSLHDALPISCFAGNWEITQDSPYSGFFRKGSQALMIGRLSAASPVTSRGEKRAFGFAGKIFPTTDAEDRKSTRLNSSHLVISYAVFCLKKKI